MRIELNKMLEKLGVGYELSPYETMPWVHYDEEKKLTCSAEVRMGPAGDDVEAEIQLLKEEDDNEDEEGSTGGREQILWMRATPDSTDQWGPKHLRIKAHDYTGEFFDWEGKGCDFFRSTVESIQMGEIPNFDDLVNQYMKDDSFYGGGKKGRIGRKSPNIKPGQLLGMKK